MLFGHHLETSDKDINDFHQDQNDDQPIPGYAVAVLQKILEQFHIFFYDTESFLDGAKARLQIEGFFNPISSLFRFSFSQVSSGESKI